MVKKLVLKRQKSKGGVEYFQLIVKGRIAEQTITMDTNLIISLLGEDVMDIEIGEEKVVGEFKIGE